MTIKNKAGEDEYIPTSAEIRKAIADEVNEVAGDKKIVILDGVGYWFTEKVNNWCCPMGFAS